MQRIFFGLGCCLTLALASCDSGPQLVHVKGKVSYAGVPLEKGLVQFEPTDGKSTSGKGGIIENGVYTAEVPRGDLRVRITSEKVVSQKPMYGPGSKMVDVTEPLVPKKYNADTTLKVTIDGRRDDLDFILEK
jgi:hypothetical protein